MRIFFLGCCLFCMVGASLVALHVIKDVDLLAALVVAGTFYVAAQFPWERIKL